MRIGLVPMSAKPYHKGHHYLVESAAVTNDKVIVFVSLSDRIKKNEFPIKGSLMADVWINELSSVMPKNVELIFGGSPVRKVYEYLDNKSSENSEDVITIYSDNVDTRSNYSESARLKYMEPMYSQGKVRFASEEFPENFTRGTAGGAPNISGTMMRGYLKSGNKNMFIDGLPNGVDGEKIWDILMSAQIEKKEETKAPLMPSSF